MFQGSTDLSAPVTPKKGTRATAISSLRSSEPKVWKIELPPPYNVPNRDTGEERFCVAIDNAFSEEWCKQMIAETERRGYEQALLNVGNGNQVLHTDVRKSSRCIWDDEKIAAEMWDRIKFAVPAQFGHMVPTRLNERLRFLKYDPGEYFKPHFDGEYMTPDCKEVSKITVLIYLNEGFEGGETAFLSPRDRFARVPFIPTTGSVLMFEHRLLHEGAELLAGRKYTIRSDVMFKWK